MLYHYQTPQGVDIKLVADSPNEPGAIEYDGPEGAILLTKRTLEQTSGAFGHLIDPVGSNPIDLDYALTAIYGINLVRLSPLDDFSYSPGIPEGAQT
jgi:hypothetical protein